MYCDVCADAAPKYTHKSAILVWKKINKWKPWQSSRNRVPSTCCDIRVNFISLDPFNIRRPATAGSMAMTSSEIFRAQTPGPFSNTFWFIYMLMRPRRKFLYIVEVLNILQMNSRARDFNETFKRSLTTRPGTPRTWSDRAPALCAVDTIQCMKI